MPKNTTPKKILIKPELRPKNESVTYDMTFERHIRSPSKADNGLTVVKILIAIAVILTIVLICVGLAFLIYYLTVTSSVDYNGYCMTDKQCKVNMVCLNSYCRCAKEARYVNRSCETESKISSILSHAKPVKARPPLLNEETIVTENLFQSTNPHVESVKYTGHGVLRVYSVDFIRPYMFLTDNNRRQVIKAHENGTFISSLTLPSSVAYLASIKNQLYITTLESTIYKVSANLQLLDTLQNIPDSDTTQYEGISYDDASDLIHIIDSGNGKILSYDGQFNSVDSIDCPVTSADVLCLYPLFYNKRIYVSTTNNSILIIHHKTLVGTIFDVCKEIDDYIYNFVIDENENLYAACNLERRVYRYRVDGTYTGQYIDLPHPPIQLGINSNGKIVATRRRLVPGLMIIG